MKKNYLLYVFTVVLLGLAIVDGVTAEKDFSDLENRNLKTQVKFSIKGFFDNSFQQEYETYINDQFIFRDNWIDLKSRSEYALGKIENNGIIYGDEGYLFEKFNSYDENKFLNNIKSINLFKEKVSTPISVMIVPNSYEVYKEYLPDGAPLIPQEEKINYIYEEIKDTNNINLMKVMSSNKSENIYYRTDHHWTTYGAYLGYSEFIKSIGEQPVKLSELDEISVCNFYGTYFSKAKPFNIEADSLVYYDINDIEMNIYGKEYTSLYDYSQLEIRDKYALFLRGNNALTVIKNTKLNNNKKILVIKDSFGNSLMPFLTQNYEEVHVIDLRTYMEKVDQYANENEFDNILILYNFINFTKDTNIVKLKY